jgi:hypothetical protein
MPGTIAILNNIPVPAGRRTVRIKYKVSIDGPDGNLLRGGTEDRYAVQPGTYRVRVSSHGRRTNAVTVEVSEGGRHYVRISPTWFYQLSTIPYFGILPRLLVGAYPGLVLRIRNSQL